MIIFAVEDFEVEPLDENFRKGLYHAAWSMLYIKFFKLWSICYGS